MIQQDSAFVCSIITLILEAIDRVEQLLEKILKNIDEGKIVIIDSADSLSIYLSKIKAESKIYTNNEIKKELNVEDKLLKKWRDNGLLAYSKIGDKYFYTSKDISDFLERTRHRAFAFE